MGKRKKSKISITMSPGVLAMVDKLAAGHRADRSWIIEQIICRAADEYNASPDMDEGDTLKFFFKLGGAEPQYLADQYPVEFPLSYDLEEPDAPATRKGKRKS